MLDNLNTWPNLEEDLRSYDTTDDDDDDDGDDDEEEDEEEEVPKVTRRPELAHCRCNYSSFNILVIQIIEIWLRDIRSTSVFKYVLRASSCILDY